MKNMLYKNSDNSQQNKQYREKKKGKSPLKREAFEAYIIWSSIPFALKRLKPLQLEGLGIDTDDELLSKLINIKTKTQFAEEFNIDRTILFDWEKRSDFQKRVEKLNRKNNVLRYKKDIDFHFTQKTIKEADAQRVKLWKQLYEGWTEKLRSDIDLNIDQTFKEQYEKDPDETVRQIIAAGKKFLVGKLSPNTSEIKNSKKQQRC